MDIDLLGPLNRFVRLYGSDTQAMLREAVSVALTTADSPQANPDLDARFYIEGSVQVWDDTVRVFVFLCDISTHVVLQPWKRDFPKSRFDTDSVTFADSVAAWIDQYVGQSEV
jgi:TolB-like protein